MVPFFFQRHMGGLLASFVKTAKVKASRRSLFKKMDQSHGKINFVSRDKKVWLCVLFCLRGGFLHFQRSLFLFGKKNQK